MDHNKNDFLIPFIENKNPKLQSFLVYRFQSFVFSKFLSFKVSDFQSFNDHKIPKTDSCFLEYVDPRFKMFKKIEEARVFSGFSNFSISKKGDIQK